MLALLIFFSRSVTSFVVSFSLILFSFLQNHINGYELRNIYRSSLVVLRSHLNLFHSFRFGLTRSPTCSCIGATPQTVFHVYGCSPFFPETAFIRLEMVHFHSTLHEVCWTVIRRLKIMNEEKPTWRLSSSVQTQKPWWVGGSNSNTDWNKCFLGLNVVSRLYSK